MNTIKNFIVALLALLAFSLTASPLAFADGKTDAEATCPGCHGVIINGIQAVGSGGRTCAQRTTAEWTATIERMNGKGCAVPVGSIAGIASYLTCVGTPSGCMSTTTTTSRYTCYNADGSSFMASGYCPIGTSYSPPPPCPGGVITPTSDHRWVCTPTTSSTTTTTIMPPFCNNGPAKLIGGSWVCPFPPQLCYDSSGVGQYISGMYPPYPCPTGMSTTPPPTCSGGLPTFDGTAWTCPTTSSTTTSTTTTTTLCNTYVNGTTQYKYSGSGSCHSFANDDVTAAHIVRDQSYCKKHMSHFNSKGNHVHVYPHPACM